MSYNFKNLNGVDRQDKPTENTTVMAFESGQPKQIPAGEFGGKGLVVDLRGYTLNTGDQSTIISDIVYDPIYEAIMAGQNVVFQIMKEGIVVFSTVIFSAVTPGSGFAALIIGAAGEYIICFTNGSYHTTA